MSMPAIGPIERQRTRRRRLTIGTVLLMLSLLMATSTGVGTGAAANSEIVVGKMVLSATTIDPTGCASGVAGRTNFGSVLPGTSVVTTSDCTIIFGSTNDTARLRIQQTDQLGRPMFQTSRGALEASFGTGGLVTTPTAPAAGIDKAYELAIQPDGYIVTAGECDMGAPTGYDICLARYKPDGTLDTNFGVGGLVTTAIAPGAGSDRANEVAIQADGKIITAGTCSMGGATGDDACLARYDSFGALDTSFGIGGRVTTATAPAAGLDQALAVTIQADGKILTAGQCSMGAPTGIDACLARYETNGALDTSFGVGGRVITNTAPGSGDDRAKSITIQTDGKIVTAGHCNMGATTGYDACLARYKTDGTLDNSFDLDGRVTTRTAPGAGWDSAESVMIQADGKIVTAGHCNMGVITGYDMCLARYNSNGALDTTFDGDGRVTTSTAAGAGNDYAYAGAIQADGKLVAAGYCDTGTSTGNDVCLVRYNANGALDATFDADGRVTTAVAPGTGADYAIAIAVQADGKIVTAGYCDMGGATGIDACLTSYDSAGTMQQYEDTDADVDVDDDADWATVGTSHLAACLRATTNAAATWTPGVTCPASRGAFWNPIPITATELATTASTVTNGAAHLRFGLRTALNQPFGDYIAPITFTVTAP